MAVRRRYRRRSRVARSLRRAWRRRTTTQKLGIIAGFVVALVLVSQHPGTGGGTASASAGTGAPPAGSPPAASRIVAFARAQLGVPYVWGGDGPQLSGGFDCSGLAMEAYAAAGISIPRTSYEQWAAGPQVSTPVPGDLVFFAGGDGTWKDPGHVGIVVDPARHLMIDAYATGTNVRYDTYGLPASAGGLTDPVGFTDPMGPR